ncbi:MAG: molybdopterin molybdotransferase [Gaiellaceae bacterium]|nr:molybdopterin molybdotransferase [Gaiellaceae bacterium]
MSALPRIDEALALVLARVAPLEAEDVPVAQAAGRVLAVPAVALTDLPPFDSSAMDGFAVRAADTPGSLTVVGESAAGKPATRELGAGEAIGISTGAVVPAGADAVVPVERTSGAVDVERVGVGENIRPRGGDTRAGEVLVEAGSVLRPAQLGALAAAGVAIVRCARRPRAAVLATGSELRPPGEALAPGEIYESNTVLIGAQLASAGALVTVLDPVGDDEQSTRAALEQGLAGDMLVTSGGVSVGPHDLVRAALAELGAEEIFWRVAVKPGKPVAFAVRGSTLVFGLPGNPVSSLVAFELFVRPALLALQGAAEPGPAYLPGRLGAPLRRNDQRDELVRARVRIETDAVVLDPVSGQESHMIVRSAAASALVLVPRGAGALSEGSPVRYLRI